MTTRTPQRITVGSRWRGFSNPYRALCAVLALLQIFLPSLVVALPSDGNVVGGHAIIQQVNPHQLDIQQTTDKAILNWNSFSIAGNESVHFMQPSVSSIALNRVIGTDPSVILGHLQSNGRIFLLNPNGILFGAGAQIDVGGLLATTLQVRNDDFMAGRYLFAQDPLKGLHTVINRGTIHVSDHGFVFLAAPGVSNEGLIVATLGQVVLGSGQTLTIDLMGDGLIHYALSSKVLDQVIGANGKPLSSAVSNTGTIQADGGQVILQAKASGDIFSSVVNQSGVVRAHSLENHGGVVQLIGGDETLVAATTAGAMRPAGDVSGAVVNTGTIDVAAGAPNVPQGSVTMVGERVGQFGSIKATGADGTNGGDVLIASTTRAMLASGSSIDVSGIGHSSGGWLRVWSDHNTFFDSGATILARGGELGGNGGFVELSGKENLGFAGTVNALAPFGSAGTLLLDPRNITIAAAGGVAYNPGVNNLFGNNLGATTIITPASINGQLANVVLQANNDITVTNAIAMTNAGVGITMQAGRSIAVNANVSTTNGNISLTANDSAATAADRLAGVGNITMGAGTTLNAGSGNISLTIGNSAVAPFSPGGITAQALTTTAGTISLQSTTASTVSGNVALGTGSLSLNNAGALAISGVISGTGGLTKNGAGTLTLSGANTYTGATAINVGTLQLGAANRIANTSAVTVAGGATFNLNNFAETIGSLSGAGNVTLGTAILTTGDATNTTFSGVMSGTGGLTKQGAGIFTLSGANTYTGATTINAGTLRVAGGAAIADTSAVTLANVAGATLDLNGTNETIGSLAGGGAAGGNVTLGAGTLTTGIATNTTYTGVISGSGGLTKQGTGIFTLSGANTYTGATTINAGTLTLGAANRIADVSAVTVAGGATFNLNNFAETIGSLSGAGNVTLGTGTLTAGGDNTSTAYSGIMSGTGGLTKQGTGTFTLSGNNTYSGVTNVSAGTLVAAVNNALGTAAGGTTVASGATLGFSGGINYATAEPVTLNGGTLANLAGNNIFAGPITLAANSAFTIADGTTMTVSGTVNGGSQLTVSSGTGGINFLSAIGGTTPLSSLSATVGSVALGPVITVGTQTYTGATTLNGNLTTTNSAITLNSPVTLGANVVLNAGNGAIAMNGTVNGAFTLTANSTGTTTFGGIVGGTTALSSLTTNAGGSTAINGGSITTVGNQTYNDNVTMNQTTTLTSTGGTVTFGGNATNNAAGAGITVDAPIINLTGGTTVATTSNGPINFFTDTLNPNGASINVGTGTFSLSPNVLTRTIEFGDVDTARVTDVYYGSNFAGVTAGSFTIGRPSHTGNIFVTGVAAAPSAINVVNGGAGSVTFENAPYVSGNQNLGVASGSGGIAVNSSLTIGTGTLRLTTSGAITQTAGAITANIAGLSAGAGISLAQPANNVATLAAQTTAGNISFTDASSLTIGNVSATVDGFHPAITGLTANTGTISLQSGGAVTQTQRILASTLSLQGSGPYTLTDNANDVTTLAANTTGNVQYNDANALVLGASNVTGNLDITTSGAITQSGVVTVTGTTTLAAGAANDITVTNAGNNFSTVGIASGNNVTLNDTNALILGASTVSGTLGVTTNGALTQSGVLTVTGVTTLSAGGNDITLTNGANDFSTVGITSGNNVALTDANALVLSASTVTGNLALTTGGPLSQTGTLAVIGTTTFTATAANTDILLDTQANNFGGAWSFAGTQSNFRDVQLRNVNVGATVPVLAGLTNLRNLTLTFDTAAMTVPTLLASGNVNLTAGGSITQSGAVTANGAVMVTATTGSITMASAATTTSVTGAIGYTAGTNVTLGSLAAGGAVNVIANGGSIFSAAGSGTNVTAGANSTLQAFNGVVGTQAAPMTVNVNTGTLGIRATTAVAGVSAFLTGTVLPGNTLTLLNVPPGLVCFNGCPVPPSNNPFGGFSGLIPLFTYDSIVPWYLHEPSDPPMISVFATYLPKSVVTEAEVNVKSNEKSVGREIPPCFPASACKPAATSLTTPAEGDGVTAR